MSRQYKRSFAMYPAWSYQKEIEELNRLSEQGWQLIRAGIFSCKYMKNSDVRYRYQLDYCGRVEDMGRYIETFREQGWEYINNTFNGWYYFRKPWDPTAPEEQYEIFTDQSSLQEMTGRWIKFAAIVAAILAAFTLCNALRLAFTPKLPTFVLFLTTLLETMYLTYGILLMRNPSKNRGLKWDRALINVFLITVLIGGGLCSYLEMYRHFICVTSSEEMLPMPAEIENSTEWISFDIPYTDNYYMHLDITVDSPICCSIIDHSGSVVYTVKTSSANLPKTKLHLKKDSYHVYLSDYAGGKLDLSLRID